MESAARSGELRRCMLPPPSCHHATALVSIAQLVTAAGQTRGSRGRLSVQVEQVRRGPTRPFAGWTWGHAVEVPGSAQTVVLLEPLQDSPVVLATPAAYDRLKPRPADERSPRGGAEDQSSRDDPGASE